MNGTCNRSTAWLGKLAILTIGMAMLTSTGCTAAPPATPTLAPTAAPTSTPQPSATPLPTATPTATATPDRTATSAARATETMAAQLAKIAPQLQAVGYTLDSGALIYSKDYPLSMTLTSYSSYWPESIITDPIKDFILKVEVKWNSTSGLAGCGIMFRAEEDLERGAQYEMDLMRLAAAPNWQIIYRKFNAWQSDVVSGRFDDVIVDEPNSVNTIILVAQGDLLQVYINDKKMQEGRSSRLAEGGIAFLTWQESGKTTCSFDNVWVWELNPVTPTPSS